jgi:enhancer of mRNA-decapping protein 3
MSKRTSTAPSSNQLAAAPPQEAPATPIKPVTAARTVTLPQSTSRVGLGKGHNTRKPSAATLEGPFSSLDIADAEEADSETKTAHANVRRASINKTRNGKPMEDMSPQKHEDNSKKTRRGGKSRKKELAAQERRNGGDLQSGPDTARKGYVRESEKLQGLGLTLHSKGNGWRNTPILQDAEQPLTRTPGVIGGRVGLVAAHASKSKTRRQKALDATNGWATEDATDIQDLPEFDFASNHAKFDKRTVFDQIRNEDTTADEDRLVSFNRIARPGTHGGKNLHPTENVLDRKPKSATNSSSEDDSEFGSSRNSRRAMSRASVKRAPVRQGSGVQADFDMGGSGLLPRANNRSFINRPYASSHATGSPRPGRIATPPDSPLDSTSRGCLRLISNERRCHAITPGGMLAVEETAEVEFGLTEDMIAENAGRGIAEVALTAINPGGRRLARENPNARPVIVVLAGNHRAGARAVAAARHLQARGPKVMVALLGFERAADWDKDVRRQVDLFRKFGGSVRAWKDTEEALKRLQAPPELIIDALLGRHKEFEALGDQDRRTVLGIVGWANKSRAACLAVETPSGVGGSTGEVAILEGEPLEVRAKYIVCLGAPRTGLLKALQNGAGRDPQWLIWVVDIGVNKPWRDAGISGGKGIKFGEHWVVQVRFAEEDGLEIKA